MPFAILLESPPPQAKEREPKFIRTKTMAKAGYPRLKELVDRAISTSEEKCIIWKCNSKRPYPQLKVTDNDIGINKETILIHRAVAQYVLKRKLIYHEKCKEVVDHHCGEKKCINPHHLFVMSPRENNEKKHWLKVSNKDRFILSAWLKGLNCSTQGKHQRRHAAINFLEFINKGINTKDVLINLHTKSSDEINNNVQEWKTLLLKSVEKELLKTSTVNDRVSHVKDLLKFVKKPDLCEIIKREEESQKKHLNVVEQADRESSKGGLLALESGKRSMVNTYNEICDAALSLPPKLRAMLAERLFKSLDSIKQE